jgi:hypothetical protein
MIRLEGRAAVYGEVWFDEEPQRDAGVDIVLYRQREAPVAGARVAPFLSMITDLRASEDEIFGDFGKDCRYKIRRADSKDGLRMEFSERPEGILEEFGAFYDAFARQKSFAPCDRKWLAAARAAGCLALSAASRGGEALVRHAYFTDGKVAWLQYTASCFRGQTSDYRALVGRANRWLHWQDMLRFRSMGLRRYDWGGLFEDESAAESEGINRFKRDFGGEPVRTYECVLPVTVKGRLYLPLRDAWRRWRLAA